jgi:hypothetical protein
MITNHILLARYFPRYGHGSFFPLVKWRNQFRRRGISFRFFNNHSHRSLLSCDSLIVDWRYIDLAVKGWIKPDGSHVGGSSFILQLLHDAKSAGVKIVLFDSADAAGTRAFDVLPYVDVWLKKQVYRDRSRYTRTDGGNHYMSWLPDEIEEIPRFKGKAVDERDLEKLAVGWNIGMLDYRSFPELVYRLRIAPSNFMPQIYARVAMRPALAGERPFIFSYRGGMKDNPRYAFARKRLVEVLHQSSDAIDGEFILGGKTSKNNYLNELRSSKTGLSPFGWGEICYRDFEIIQNGALLLKPSVDHLQTWPEFFIPGETYIPIDWEYKSLVDTLNAIENNLDDYRPVAKRAQEQFLHYQSDHQTFIDHFCAQLGY